MKNKNFCYSINKVLRSDLREKRKAYSRIV